MIKGSIHQVFINNYKYIQGAKIHEQNLKEMKRETDNSKITVEDLNTLTFNDG